MTHAGHLARWGVLVISALLPAIARAQPQDEGQPVTVDGTEVSDLNDIEDASFEGLLGMDLSDRLGATKAVSRQTEEVLRAPATLSTLSGTDLRRAGANTIPDLLRWVPGVQVFRSAPGNFVVSLRGAGGLGGNNVIVTVDGIPINSPLDGTVDWDAIPIHPQDVERVEVVRGPVSTAYGANAYTGVINIVTRDAVGVSPAHALRTQAGVGGGEVGGLASLSGRLVHVGPRLRLKWLFDTTYDAVNRGSGGSLQPAHERAGFVGRLGWQWGENDRAFLEVGRAVSRRSSLEHLVLESERQRRELLFAQLKLEGTAAGVVRGYQLWARGTRLLTRTDAAAYEGFSYADTDSNRAALGGDLDLAFSSMFGASLGAVGTLDHVDAPYVHPGTNARVRSGYGLYAGLSAHPTDSLDVRLAVRGDVSALTAALEESYRGSVVYHDESFALRLSGATAFREPSYVEAAGRFVDPSSRLILLEGTPDVASPRNSSLELAAMVAPTSALSINPVVYVSRFDNAIIEDFAPLVRRTFRNDADDRALFGAELSVSYRISDSLALHPTASLIRFLNDDESRVATIGVAEQNSSLTAGIRVDGWLLDERLGYGLGALYVSGRAYSVRAGIPPRIIATDVPGAAHLDGAVEYELTTKQPLRLSLRGATQWPSQLLESPLPNAAPLGSSLILGLEYASE